MNKSESIGELATALVKAQTEIKAIEMSGTNPFLHNRYASLGDVIAATKPALNRQGLAVSQFVSSNDGQIGVTTVLMHTSGQWISDLVSLPITEEKGKSQAQVAGSIVTYLRRYALAGLVCAYSDEDQDGNGAPTKPTQAQPLDAVKYWRSERAALVKDALTKIRWFKNDHQVSELLASWETAGHIKRETTDDVLFGQLNLYASKQADKKAAK